MGGGAKLRLIAFNSLRFSPRFSPRAFFCAAFSASLSQNFPKRFVTLPPIFVNFYAQIQIDFVVENFA